MTQHSKHLSRSACALAVSLLLSACGGGEATDTVAPTVAITDNVAGTTAAAAVTFTFTFSEDVGSSFAAEDITVTGGTAGTLTKVDAMHYTLVVTPAASSTGTINVAVAALRFTDLALNGNTVAASAQQAFDTMVATAPTTAAATPTALSANVLSIYSDAYTPVGGVVLRPDWGQSTAVSEITIEGNKAQKYTAFNYEGITFTPINVSAMTKLHIDVWTPDLTALDVFVLAGGAEQSVQLKPTKSGWNSFDINLNDFTTLNKSAVKELKLVSTGGSTLYSDNIYFWKPAAAVNCGMTEPTCAPTTTIPAGSVTIYSDAATTAGFNPFPNWGQATQYSEATLANNKSLKYTALNYEGIEFTAVDVSAKGKVHFDLWSPDLTSVKISLISAGSENSITQAVTARSWNSVDIDLSQYVAAKTAIFQIKLESLASGTLYVDNIHFWGTGSTGVGGVGTFAGGIFASDYTGSLAAGTQKSTLGGNVGFFFDQRLFDTKVYQEGSVTGSAADPGGVHNFWYGMGKAQAPVYANAYFGGFVNAPGNAPADASAFAKIKLKFWGDAETWERPNFTPQVEVVLQGPTNAACTNGSGRPEITRTVTGQKIGAGADYTIAKSEFAMKADCGGAYTVNSIWASVGVVAVQLNGTNLQYTNSVSTGGVVTYPTFLNIGPISFVN